MLSRGEESCGEVGLNSGFSGFFMVGEDMSARGRWGGGQRQEAGFKFVGIFTENVTADQDLDSSVLI